MFLNYLPIKSTCKVLDPRKQILHKKPLRCSHKFPTYSPTLFHKWIPSSGPLMTKLETKSTIKVWMPSLINKGNYINYNYIKINIKGYILLNLWKSWLPKQHEIRACTVFKSPWIWGKVLEFNFHVYHITVKPPKGIRIIW